MIFHIARIIKDFKILKMALMLKTKDFMKLIKVPKEMLDYPLRIKSTRSMSRKL